MAAALKTAKAKPAPIHIKTILMEHNKKQERLRLAPAFIYQLGLEDDVRSVGGDGIRHRFDFAIPAC